MPDTIAELTRTAGGLAPHSTVDGIPSWVRDYGCRRCWRELQQHETASGVCTIGPTAAIIHRDCCPACTPQEGDRDA
jgi:hypothetical protein